MIYALLGFAVAALGAVTTFAVMLSRAKDEREAARVLASSTAGELVRAKDAIERLTLDVKNEKGRADALDDLLAEVDAGPVDGAYERLLQKWRAARVRAAGDDPRAVPASPTATTTDDLLRPGEG